MPIDIDLLIKRGLISPDSAAQYGIMSDASPDTVEPGQQYAMDVPGGRNKPLQPIGEGGGGSTKAPGGSLAPNPLGSSIPEISQNLERALLHSESSTKFPEMFEQIKTMPPDQLKALAKEFTGGNASSAQQALDKIWNQHQQLNIIRAKRNFMKGRTAG